MKVNFNPSLETRARASHLLAQDMEMLHQFEDARCVHCGSHQREVPAFAECPVLLRCGVEQLTLMLDALTGVKV